MVVTISTRIPVPPGKRPWKATKKRAVFMCDSCGKVPAAEGWDGYCVHCACVYEAERKIRRGRRLIEEGQRALASLAGS